MKTLFIDEKFKYDGSQLRSLFGFLDYKIQGDSVVSWVGPCDIPMDKIVDGQDLLEGSKIYSEEMLHFVIEVFDAKLIQMVLWQRLFCEIVKAEVLNWSKNKINLVRSGDDLYLKVREGQGTGSAANLDSNFSKPIKNKDLKLNISIATVSPVSGLVHFGINVSSKNTPVKTLSLNDIHKLMGGEHNIKDWAKSLMNKFSEEFKSAVLATQKVKWVK